jgi:hypothetical protein
MKPEHTRSAQTVFALFLLLLFAGMSLLLVMLGGNTYRTITTRMDRNNDLRTSLSYVANKVHASGGDGEVRMEDGVEVLAIRQTGTTRDYVTYIYTYRGSLCEYYTAQGDPFSPQLGEEIVAHTTLSFRENGDLLTAVLTQESGAQETVTLHLHSANEA